MTYNEDIEETVDMREHIQEGVGMRVKTEETGYERGHLRNWV